MLEHEWEIVYFVTQNGRIPFREWFEALRDFRAQATITARLARIRAGNFGQSTFVGQAVFELKINYGSGYRVYFARAGTKIILLLCGGDKSTQQKDIQMAHYYWQQFKESPR